MSKTAKHVCQKFSSNVEATNNPVRYKNGTEISNLNYSGCFVLKCNNRYLVYSHR